MGGRRRRRGRRGRQEEGGEEEEEWGMGGQATLPPHPRSASNVYRIIFFLLFSLPPSSYLCCLSVFPFLFHLSYEGIRRRVAGVGPRSFLSAVAWLRARPSLTSRGGRAWRDTSGQEVVEEPEEVHKPKSPNQRERKTHYPR